MAPFIFIDRISRGKPIKQFGDGSTSRDYTYIDDIVDGVIRAVDRPYDYEVFNLGKGDGTSLKDFINLVQKYTKKNATINVLPEQPGDVPCKFLCCLPPRSSFALLRCFSAGIYKCRKYFQWNLATFSPFDTSPSFLDTCADVNHAKRLLGYKSSVTFEEGIKRTVEWYNSPDAVIARDEEELEKEKAEKTTAKKKEGKKEEKAAGDEDDKKRRKLSIKNIDEDDKYYPTDGTYYPLY